RKRTRVKGLWVTDGGHYHAKLWRNGKAKWVPLGTDYDAAKKKLNRYKAGDPIPSRASLAEAAEDWLNLAVATRRSPEGQATAATWVQRYMLNTSPGCSARSTATVSGAIGCGWRSRRSARRRSSRTQSSAS